MIELILAFTTGISISAAVAAVLYAKRITVFLQSQAIDERNQRMHEQRSLISRLRSVPTLSIDPSAPDVPEIDDMQPYISDYEMDDERFEAFMEERYPSRAVGEALQPVPVPED